MSIHLMEKWQSKAIDLEKKIKITYKESGTKFARQLINGAKEAVDYGYKAERDLEWWVKYCHALEERL